MRAASIRPDEGAALLSVLMLVALMAGLIALGMERLNTGLRRAQAQTGAQEARLNLWGAEAVAVTQVDRALADGRINALVAGGGAFSVPVAGGRITARLSDAQNCFNLNSLLHGGPVARGALQRVLILAGVSAEQASATAAAAAERDRPFVDRHELAHLPGMSPAAMAPVQDWICALPVTMPVRLNVNTLRPDQAALLVALAAPMAQPGPVAAALSARPAGGYADVAAFLSASGLAGADAALLDVRSGWFRLDLVARLGDAGLSERALIDARARPARLVRRTYGGL